MGRLRFRRRGSTFANIRNHTSSTSVKYSNCSLFSAFYLVASFARSFLQEDFTKWDSFKLCKCWLLNQKLLRMTWRFWTKRTVGIPCELHAKTRNGQYYDLQKKVIYDRVCPGVQPWSVLRGRQHGWHGRGVCKHPNISVFKNRNILLQSCRWARVEKREFWLAKARWIKTVYTSRYDLSRESGSLQIFLAPQVL